jgi:hypothetical protein
MYFLVVLLFLLIQKPKKLRRLFVLHRESPSLSKKSKITRSFSAGVDASSDFLERV